MCFMLYAATTKPILTIGRNGAECDLIVMSLSERDAPISQHFSYPEIQQIGSTSGCGCGFPHVTLTRGEWVGYAEVEDSNPEHEAVEDRNRSLLVALLRETNEKVIELYGVWYDSEKDFAKPIHVSEEIQLAKILEPDFYFKERGFYRVSI